MARQVMKLAGSVTQHWSRRWGILLSLIIGIGAGGFYVQNLVAVHDTGRFQLDGDARQSTNTATTPAGADDWDNVCYTHAITPVALGGGGLSTGDATLLCGTSTGTTNSVATSWVAERPLSYGACTEPLVPNAR